MIRVGNASGFYGDRFTAVHEMLTGGDLDVLTGDYLAELTMLVLGRQRLKDPRAGYAETFLRQLADTLDLALGRGVKIVTNAGGLNPAGLADAIRALGTRAKVAHVEGDDLVPRAASLGLGDALTANAYLGAWGIAECLRAGADVVITGRVTDASLTVGPAAAHFGWHPTDYDRLAGATVAGHLIECGPQVTGGNYAFFTELDPTHPPFPLAEIHDDGTSVITKHPNTGGAVTRETVTAQLLYEIQGPHYLGPDVTTHLDTVTLTADGPDRVRVSGVRGTPPPDTVKVCVNTLAGFKNSVTFILCGLDIEEKATLARRQVERALGPDGITWTLARTDHPDAATEETASALLHATIHTEDPTRAKAFARTTVELALASYPGFTLTTPPPDPTPIGVYRPAYLPRHQIPHTAVLPDGTRHPFPWPPETAPTPAAQANSTPTSPRAPAPATTQPPTTAAHAVAGPAHSFASAQPPAEVGAQTDSTPTPPSAPSPATTQSPRDAVTGPARSLVSAQLAACTASFTPAPTADRPPTGAGAPQSTSETAQSVAPPAVTAEWPLDAGTQQPAADPAVPLPAAQSPTGSITPDASTLAHPVPPRADTAQPPTSAAVQRAVPHPAQIPTPPANSEPVPPLPTNPSQPTPRNANSAPQPDTPPTSHPGTPPQTRRVPLGTILGARSGDKGGDANLGVWARTPDAYPWLVHTLTTDRLRTLLPETADLPIERHLLPNLNAVNFVIHTLLGQGVAASTRFDPQAKALGEWLRARYVDVPEALL
ncbi:acyclic terpene utilization AtuA family protein [Actinokineospora auranticolor]|uniref:Uncharacterized protein DUF1446 n=1 Tax=Actinokineospora auranticolor TaxID=155976 RepID=A0A2S6GHP5_9PSEU|nr:acyclic terpene utilization AtuA family protein [Actinokineospora auranticolor]PPK64720.1 uncharacterized protein DUF1446 [Actinokineospora auranticolor]